MERFEDWLPHEMLSITTSLLSLEDRCKAREAGFSLPFTQAEYDFLNGIMSYSEERIEMEFTCHADSYTSSITNCIFDANKKVRNYYYKGVDSNVESRALQCCVQLNKLYRKKREMNSEEWERSFEALLNVMYRLNIPYYCDVKYFDLHHKLKRVPPADLLRSIMRGNDQETREITALVRVDGVRELDSYA